MRKSNKPRTRQLEIWDDGAISRKLGEALLLVICGNEKDQRHGLNILIDVSTSDVRMARRMVAIMDQNPKLKEQCGDLYEMCLKQIQPNLAPPRNH